MNQKICKVSLHKKITPVWAIISIKIKSIREQKFCNYLFLTKPTTAESTKIPKPNTACWGMKFQANPFQILQKSLQWENNKY